MNKNTNLKIDISWSNSDNGYLAKNNIWPNVIGFGNTVESAMRNLADAIELIFDKEIEND